MNNNNETKMKVIQSNESDQGPTWALMDNENHLLASCPRVDPSNGLDISKDEAERMLLDEIEPDEERDGIFESLEELRGDDGPDAYAEHWDGVMQVHVAGQESLGIGQPTHDPKQVAQQRAAASGGCPECGVAYSFYFGVQLHSEDCKIGGAK